MDLEAGGRGVWEGDDGWEGIVRCFGEVGGLWCRCEELRVSIVGGDYCCFPSTTRRWLKGMVMMMMNRSKV